MSFSTQGSVVSEKMPREFPYGLVHYLDLAVGPDDRVYYFDNSPEHSGYLDIFSDEMKRQIYWAGCGEGHELTDIELTHICERLDAYARMYGRRIEGGNV